MSLQTDAETVADLCSRIIAFEILRAQLTPGSPTYQGGTVQLIPGNPDSAVTLSGAQKTALLALQDGWKATAKSITSAW